MKYNDIVYLSAKLISLHSHFPSLIKTISNKGNSRRGIFRGKRHRNNFIIIFSDNSVGTIIPPGMAQSLDDWGGKGKGFSHQLMSGVGQNNQLGSIDQLGQNDQLFLANF